MDIKPIVIHTPVRKEVYEKEVVEKLLSENKLLKFTVGRMYSCRFEADKISIFWKRYQQEITKDQ